MNIVNVASVGRSTGGSLLCGPSFELSINKIRLKNVQSMEVPIMRAGNIGKGDHRVRRWAKELLDKNLAILALPSGKSFFRITGVDGGFKEGFQYTI